MKDQWGGGILESKGKNPKDLQRFIKNKKQKQVVIGSIIGILLLIGGITLYRTFAMYKVEKSFDVLNGTVPDFSNGDVTLAILVNGHKSEKIPEENNNYKVIVSCENAEGNWDYNNWGLNITKITENKVKCNIYFSNTFSGYIMSLSNIDEDIIKQEHEATDQTGTYATTDYRYIGANPNNYVCLEESGQCTEENLYRIIGVIPTQKEENGDYEDRVKLVSNNSIGNYSWDENGNTNFENSTLKTEILNKTYWLTISSYQNYIENVIWYVGQGLWASSTNEYYKNERSKKGINTNIALMSASDYGLATGGGSSCYDLNMGTNSDWINNTTCAKDDWLQLNSFVLNIIDNSRVLWINGHLNSATLSDRRSVYPSFYLKSSVKYLSGDGSKNNPYKITISEN